jgi:uncharacterized protein (DUF1684 family)
MGLLFLSTDQRQHRYNTGMEDETYRKGIENWRAELNGSIRKENGWLALAGLFWLKLGKSDVGSDSKCRIQLPPRLPASIGHLEYDGRTVSFRATPGQKVNVNGSLVDFASLKTDITDSPSFITLEDVRFVIIERGNRFGVRMWDNQREERKTFPARTWFDIDESFRVPAIYTAYDRPKKVFFPGIMGEKSEFPVEGYLSFEFNGKGYQLDANKEDDGSLFVRFWDPTSRESTYPTGRYLEMEEVDGKLFIDFNKAYNPPCAITDFATCVFAPEQNHLDFRVIAGETYTR